MKGLFIQYLIMKRPRIVKPPVKVSSNGVRVGDENFNYLVPNYLPKSYEIIKTDYQPKHKKYDTI